MLSLLEKFIVNKLFNALFCGLAPAWVSVKLRCLLILYTIIYWNSFLILLHKDIPFLFSNFLCLPTFINIDIFHWCGISSEWKIILKNVCSVCVRTSPLYLRTHFSFHLGLHFYGFLMLSLLDLLHAV